MPTHIQTLGPGSDVRPFPALRPRLSPLARLSLISPSLAANSKHLFNGATDGAKPVEMT